MAINSAGMVRMISRRGFVRLAGGGVLVGGVGLQLVVEACSSLAPTVSAPGAASGGGTASGGGGGGGAAPGNKNAAALPAYIAPTLATQAEYHSADPRITDGYDRFPKNPTRSWTKNAPGSGSNVNVFMVAYYPMPSLYENNQTWQEINKQLNANVQMSLVPSSDYPVKIGTIMASNDLPDIIHVYNGIGAAPSLPSFFKAQCADLTPYPAGDAVRDYPNLAAIPTYAWNNSLCAIEGKLYQWPIHRYLPLEGFYKNSDIYDKAFGADYTPRDLDDWNRMLREINDPKGGTWAMGGAPGPARFFGMYGYSAMFGAPNKWSLDGAGKLTKELETEEFKATVGWMLDTWKAGLWYPDSLQLANARTDGFVPGKFATTIEAFGNSWNDFWRRGLQLNPPRHFGFIKPFRARAGDKPISFITGGFISTNVMKKASPDRIRELLRIVDFLAAPFGTQEDLLLSYGLQGTDYTLDDDGQPQTTQAGITNAGYVPWRYISQHPYVQYQADLPGYTKASFEAEQIQVNAGVLDPTLGYYSPTLYSKGTLAEMNFRQAVIDIVVGRRPFSDYDQITQEWRTAAGDQVRKEYLEAFAANA
jgi:putative aldouronate transport system substrate-binding protein